MKLSFLRSRGGLAAVLGLVAAFAAALALAPPAARAASSGTYWVYRDGDFTWPGDYSYSATIDYRDKTGMPEGEKYDIAVTVTAPWGAWQPYATGMNFDRRGKTSLVFKIKATHPGSNFSVQFLKVGDLSVVDAQHGGQHFANVADYCTPVVGSWVTCTLPLDFLLNDNGVVLPNFYKFAIQSHLGAADKFYLADVGIQ